jgi:hypothetical protein
MLKVSITDASPGHNETYRDVIGWSCPGGRTLILEFQDGTTLGVTGFLEFLIERTDNPQAPNAR